MYKAGKNGSRDHVDKDGKIFAPDCHQVELKRQTVITETETVIAERKITVSVRFGFNQSLGGLEKVTI